MIKFSKFFLGNLKGFKAKTLTKTSELYSLFIGEFQSPTVYPKKNKNLFPGLRSIRLVDVGNPSTIAFLESCLIKKLELKKLYNRLQNETFFQSISYIFYNIFY